jgi:hypothetical protein
MGSLSVYLLPDSVIDPREYSRRAKQALLDLGIITNLNYANDPTWWLAEEGSARFFVDGSEDERGFQFCILNASRFMSVVPQDPAVEPSCPACGSTVSDEYYELFNDIHDKYERDERRRSSALIAARVTCPSCHASSALASLRDEVGIYLSGTWINFDDTPGPLRGEVVRAFDAATGVKHKALTYWYT